MEFYFAPMEGITGHIYRRAFHKYFPAPDKYFTPFISPDGNKILRNKEKRDVLPENNIGMQVVPQIITNRADYFLMAAEYLKKELNISHQISGKIILSRFTENKLFKKFNPKLLCYLQLF